MRKKHLRFGRGFRVALSNKRAQVAEMVLEPGKSEGDPGNRHRGADQWLFVVSGAGVAIVNERRHVLRAGSLILIEQGDRHEVKATGRDPMRTLNFYAPPAYDSAGDERPAGKRR
jgi:mannose-6-phosphate isomerase-like protein (cupin superfamily)